MSKQAQLSIPVSTLFYIVAFIEGGSGDGRVIGWGEDGGAILRHVFIRVVFGLGGYLGWSYTGIFPGRMGFL